MYHIMRIFIVSALISIYQTAKSEASVSGHTVVFKTRHFVSQSIDSEVVMKKSFITRDDSHPYPPEKRDSGSTAPISNKYRSDKKEYRFCLLDRMHHRSSVHDPAEVLPAPAFMPFAETFFPISGEPQTLSSTEKRE
jgi:hypothetical protein